MAHPVTSATACWIDRVLNKGIEGDSLENADTLEKRANLLWHATVTFQGDLTKNF